MSFETKSSEGLICPYCGHINKPGYINQALIKPNLRAWCCDECEEAFVAEVVVRYEWTGRRRKLSDAEIENQMIQFDIADDNAEMFAHNRGGD